MGFWAAVGGWFAIPIGVGAATRIVTTLAMPDVPDTDPRLLALFGAAQAGSAYACYRLTDRVPQGSGKRSFLRGGMWGSGVSAVFDAGSIALVKAAGSQPVTTRASLPASTAATSPAAQLADLHAKLFRGGFFKP